MLVPTVAVDASMRTRGADQPAAIVAPAVHDDAEALARRPSADDTPMLTGWGRLPGPGVELRSEDLARITTDVPLTRGLARSYGDSSLPPASRPLVAATPLADRILAFDESTGILRAEAGLSLVTLNRLMLPWYSGVTSTKPWAQRASPRTVTTSGCDP